MRTPRRSSSPAPARSSAIAENAPYGTGKGQTEINYAVNSADGGSPQGVQTGSSSKLFTLVTALNQGYNFGFTLPVPGTETINGYTNCQGGPAGQYNGINGAYNVTNAEDPSRPPPSPCTPGPLSRSTSSTRSWKSRSGCATS